MEGRGGSGGKMIDFDQILEGTRLTHTINEKAPEFLYSAFKNGEEVLFAKRDREPWKVVMDYDWFVENLINKKKSILVCPHCGKEI